MASAALPQPLGAPDDPLLDGLVALCAALQRPSSAEALVAGLPLEGGRLTVELLPRAAERAGLSARLVRRDLDAIPDATLPCLLLLRDGRACVLVERRAGGRAAVVLPETGHGMVEMALTELREGFAGVALFARPAYRPDVATPDVPGSAQAWFVSALRAQWPVYGQVALAACLINLFALASPLFVMNVYDRVVPNQAFETLWVLAAGVATVFGFDFVLRTLRGYFVDSAGKAADLQIAARLFNQVLGIRMASRPPSAGAFASNLRDYETLREFFTSATLTALVDLPFVLLFVLFVWLIGGPLALIPALAVPLVLLAGLAIQVPLGSAVRASFRESAARHGLLVETINGLETIKSVGAEARMQRAFEAFVATTAETGARVRGLSALAVNLATLAAALVTAGVVVFGVYLIADGRSAD